MDRPPRVFTTARFVLRVWQDDDADAHYAALRHNHDHLRHWEGWAQTEPSLSTSRQWTEWCGHLYEMGRGFIYGLFDPGTGDVIGSAGLHPIAGSPDLSVGYWTSVDHVRQGHASGAA